MNQDNITYREQFKNNLDAERQRIIKLIPNAVIYVNQQHIDKSSKANGSITFPLHFSDFNGIDFTFMGYQQIHSNSFTGVLGNDYSGNIDIKKLWKNFSQLKNDTIEVPFCLLKIDIKCLTSFRNCNHLIIDCYNNFTQNIDSNYNNMFRTKAIKICNGAYVWVVLFLDTSEEGNFYFSNHDVVEEVTSGSCISFNNVKSNNDFGLSQQLVESKIPNFKNILNGIKEMLTQNNNMTTDICCELDKLSEQFSSLAYDVTTINDNVQQILKLMKKV